MLSFDSYYQETKSSVNLCPPPILSPPYCLTKVFILPSLFILGMVLYSVKQKDFMNTQLLQLGDVCKIPKFTQIRLFFIKRRYLCSVQVALLHSEYKLFNNMLFLNKKFSHILHGFLQVFP